MALPQLFQVSAFDASTEQIFRFSYDGNQTKKNRMIIYNNSNNDVIYDTTVESLQLHHTLPANTLSNGIMYSAAVECFDKNNTSSGISNKILFYCFSTPLFRFSDISENLVVNNSVLHTTLSYSQEQGEELNSYQFYLYNHNKTEVYKSGIKYDTANMSVSYTSLTESNYFARAVGETLNGMKLDTGYIPFSVQYEAPNIFSIMEATNEADKGRIKLSVNVIALEAVPEGDVSFIDKSLLDLTAEGSKIVFGKGFNIADDFTMQLLWAKSPIYNKDFMIFEDVNGNTISLCWERGIFECNGNTEKSYIKLSAKSAVSCVLFSNYVDAPTDIEKTMIWLRKTNNDYSIKIENLREV